MVFFHNAQERIQIRIDVSLGQTSGKNHASAVFHKLPQLIQIRIVADGVAAEDDDRVRIQRSKIHKVCGFHRQLQIIQQPADILVKIAINLAFALAGQHKRKLLGAFPILVGHGRNHRVRAALDADVAGALFVDVVQHENRADDQHHRYHIEKSFGR